MAIYTCKTCSKDFQKKSNLVQHERIHTGEKPFECKECGKRFAQAGNLAQHQTSHEFHHLRWIRGADCEKPHKCTNSGCTKSFISKSSLTTHRRTCRFGPNSKASKTNSALLPNDGKEPAPSSQSKQQSDSKTMEALHGEYHGLPLNDYVFQRPEAFSNGTGGLSRQGPGAQSQTSSRAVGRPPPASRFTPSSEPPGSYPHYQRNGQMSSESSSQQLPSSFNFNNGQQHMQQHTRHMTSPYSQSLSARFGGGSQVGLPRSDTSYGSSNTSGSFDSHSQGISNAFSWSVSTDSRGSSVPNDLEGSRSDSVVFDQSSLNPVFDHPSSSVGFSEMFSGWFSGSNASQNSLLGNNMSLLSELASSQATAAPSSIPPNSETKVASDSQKPSEVQTSDKVSIKTDDGTAQLSDDQPKEISKSKIADFHHVSDTGDRGYAPPSSYHMMHSVDGRRNMVDIHSFQHRQPMMSHDMLNGYPASMQLLPHNYPGFSGGPQPPMPPMHGPAPTRPFTKGLDQVDSAKKEKLSFHQRMMMQHQEERRQQQQQEIRRRHEQLRLQHERHNRDQQAMQQQMLSQQHWQHSPHLQQQYYMQSYPHQQHRQPLQLPHHQLQHHQQMNPVPNTWSSLPSNPKRKFTEPQESKKEHIKDIESTHIPQMLSSVTEGEKASKMAKTEVKSPVDSNEEAIKVDKETSLSTDEKQVETSLSTDEKQVDSEVGLVAQILKQVHQASSD